MVNIAGEWQQGALDYARVSGARYNRRIGLSIERIRRNISYGNPIMKLWPRFTVLLR